MAGSPPEVIILIMTKREKDVKCKKPATKVTGLSDINGATDRIRTYDPLITNYHRYLGGSYIALVFMRFYGFMALKNIPVFTCYF